MKVKAIIALCLCLCLCLLSACGGAPSGSAAAQPEGSLPPAEEAQTPAPAETPDEHPEYRLYYEYISSVIVPRCGLAELEAFEYINSARSGEDYDNGSLLEENGSFGLVSAVIRDFDMDGSQDLVAFYLGKSLTREVWQALQMGSSTSLTFVLSMELYGIENDRVVLKDTCPCVNIMATDSWGGIHAYLEKLEDGIYIYSTASAIDYTTEGYSPHTIFHVQDGKFVFDYISGVSYGQGSPGTNQNLIMGTTNIDPTEYTFYDCFNDPEGVRTVLSLSFELTDGDAGTMLYHGEDRTKLREVLENGADTAFFPELPQGGLVPEEECVTATRDRARDFADYVASASGCVYVEDSVKTSSSRVSYYFETEEYTYLSISFDPTTYELLHISVSAGGYPVAPDWYGMKDAVIDWPELGLDRAELEFMYGSGVSMGAYTNGVDITGAKVYIQQISGTDFIIEYIYE